MKFAKYQFDLYFSLSLIYEMVLEVWRLGPPFRRFRQSKISVPIYVPLVFRFMYLFCFPCILNGVWWCSALCPFWNCKSSSISSLIVQTCSDLRPFLWFHRIPGKEKPQHEMSKLLQRPLVLVTCSENTWKVFRFTSLYGIQCFSFRFVSQGRCASAWQWFFFCK